MYTCPICKEQMSIVERAEHDATPHQPAGYYLELELVLKIVRDNALKIGVNTIMSLCETAYL